MSDLDKAVTQVIDTYRSAVLAKDVKTLMWLYDPDVCVFDAWGVWSYRGAEAWQRAVEGWFTSLGTEKCRVRFDDIATWGGREFTMLGAVVTYAGESADGKPLRTMQNRLSWGLRTSGHVLRIVHEHTSAPIGFEDMKAILERTT